MSSLYSRLTAGWGDSLREESCVWGSSLNIPGLRGTVAYLPTPVSSSSDGCQILLSMGESFWQSDAGVGVLSDGVAARLAGDGDGGWSWSAGVGAAGPWGGLSLLI